MILLRNKATLFFLIVGISLLGYGLHYTSNAISNDMLYSYISQNPIEASKEKLYHDAVVAMLLPYINNAVSNYYGKNYQVIPANIKVLNIMRQKEAAASSFLIKLQINLYPGSYIDTIIDNLTLKVDNAGSIKVENLGLVKNDTTIPIIK